LPDTADSVLTIIFGPDRREQNDKPGMPVGGTGNATLCGESIVTWGKIKAAA